MRTIAGQPSEDTELIRQSEQWESDALLQTTNPFPETMHNAQWTCIRQSFSTMHDTNSHPPTSVAYCYHGAKTHPMPNPHLTASSIKGSARKTESETMVTNARWKGALSCAKLPVSITIPTPSISSSAAIFLCPHMAAENMQTCSLGTLSQWDTKVASSRKELHTVRKQQLWKVHLK